MNEQDKFRIRKTFADVLTEFQNGNPRRACNLLHRRATKLGMTHTEFTNAANVLRPSNSVARRSCVDR